MRRILIYLYTSLFKFFTAINGTTSVREIFKHKKLILTYDFVTHNGYKITIHCQKREYVKTFQRGLKKGGVLVVYDVYSEVDDKLPENYKRAFSIVTTFPPIVSTLLDDRIQARIIVHAYLDMIQTRLIDELDITKETIH